jgi:hypothetical protein
MRSLVLLLPLAALVLSVGSTSFVIAKPFMEVHATVAGSAESGGPLAARVDRILFYRGESAPVGTDTLVMDCPGPDLLPWRTLLTVGQTVALEWTVDSKGGAGTLAIAGSGWSRACACPNRPGLRPTLFGAFVTEDGRLERTLVVTRARGLRNRIPLFKASPRPPRQVRIRCGWDEASLASK